MNDITSIFLEGKVKWAKVLKPSPKFDSEDLEYTLDVEVSDATLEELYTTHQMSRRSLAKEDPDTGEKYVTFRRPAKSKAGNELGGPLVVGKNLEPLTDMIGNGSKCKVKLDLIPYSNKFGSGNSVRLNAVQVLEHVHYEPTTSRLDGFEASEADASAHDVI